MYATIQEYLDTLTPAERERHKEFIAECQDREEALNEIAVACRRKREKLAGLTGFLFTEMLVLFRAARQSAEMADKTLRVAEGAIKANRKNLAQINECWLTAQKSAGRA